MISARYLFPFPLLLLVFLLSACGGDSFGDDDENGAPQPGKEETGAGDEGPDSGDDGSGSDGSGTDDEEEDESGADLTLEGRAVKGVLGNADVSLHEYDPSGEGQWQQVVPDTETDEEGYFSFEQLPSNIGPGPFRLRVRQADQGSWVRCDVPAGCGEEAEFGEQASWPGELELMAVIPGSSLEEEAFAAVTPVTHLAALWALHLPRISNASALASLEQAAQWFDLEGGAEFVYETPLDITSESELEEASDDMRKQALLGTALGALVWEQEGSFEEIGAILNLHLGTLPEMALTHLKGALGGTLDALGNDHTEHQEKLQDANTMLQEHFTALAEGSLVLPVPGPADAQAAHVADALDALDDLDHYLKLAEIDESGDFLANLMAEFKWLYDEDAREDSVGMFLVALEAVTNTALVALEIAGMDEAELEQQAGECMALDLLLVMHPEEPDENYMEACVAQDLAVTLKLVGSRGAQQVDLVTGLNSSGDLQGTEPVELMFTVSGNDGDEASGTIANDTALLTVDPGTTFSMVASDPEAVEHLFTLLGQVLQGEMPSEEELDPLDTLEIELAASGGGSIARQGTGQTEDIAIHDSMASLVVSVPDFLDGNALFQVTADGHLQVTGAQAANVLDLAGELSAGIGAEAGLSTDFVFSFRDMPEMDVLVDGSVSGLVDLAVAFVNDPESFFQGDIVAMIDDFLDLQGEASISIDDADRGNPAYDFELDNMALTVRSSDAQDDAETLTFFVTSPLGGYLFAGDDLVGVVRIHLEVDGLDTAGGVKVHVIDEPTARYYSPGALSDVLDEDLMEFLNLLLGTLQS